MPHIRSEIAKGIVVLSVFLALIVAASYPLSYSFAPSGYTHVSIEIVTDEPLPFEGHNISSSAMVTAVSNHGSYLLLATEEGVRLVFSSSTDVPATGDLVLFRGTSYVFSNGTVMIHEFYIMDETSSIIRSVPGIILFVVLFFAVFTVNFGRLAFVVRRFNDA